MRTTADGLSNNKPLQKLCFMNAFLLFLGLLIDLKTVAECSFETLVNFDRTILFYISDASTLHNHHWEPQIQHIVTWRLKARTVEQKETATVTQQGVKHIFTITNQRAIAFFLLERPNLFAICNNTFSKWWEGWRMACRRVLSSTPLLVRGTETGGDRGE
jgi:hypothetical protein